MSTVKKIGIVGFGHIGQYLYEAVKSDENLQIGFVWNRTPEKIAHLPPDEILHNLDDFSSRGVDLIVEVAHLSITRTFGEKFLEHTNYMIGSPTALADAQLEGNLRAKALQYNHALYIPAGAFWGGEDVTKMADNGSLRGLKVTMKKHPASFKLLGELAEVNSKVGDEPVVLYDGPVRQLCPLAPANVNTMACGAIAAHNLGFDGVQGCLVADKSLNAHIVEIEVTGPRINEDDEFKVRTVRYNPCQMGAVTGSATYASFVNSMKRAFGKGKGVHLC